jgi:hypothetical protein
LGGSGDGVEADGDVFGIEEAIELGAASAELTGHGLLGFLLAAHGLLELPGQDALDGYSFDLFAQALFFEEAVEGGAAVVEVLANLFWLHGAVDSCVACPGIVPYTVHRGEKLDFCVTVLTSIQERAPREAAVTAVDMTQVLKDAPVGEWIALSKDRSEILGTGKTLQQAIDAAKNKGEADPIVLKVPSVNALIL